MTATELLELRARLSRHLPNDGHAPEADILNTRARPPGVTPQRLGQLASFENALGLKVDLDKLATGKGRDPHTLATELAVEGGKLGNWADLHERYQSRTAAAQKFVAERSPSHPVAQQRPGRSNSLRSTVEQSAPRRPGSPKRERHVRSFSQSNGRHLGK